MTILIAFCEAFESCDYYDAKHYCDFTNILLSYSFHERATADPTLKRKSVSGKNFKIYLLFTNA